MSSTNAQMSFVFGPVPFRRLGSSLGVDLVPYKVCSYDCIYCQLGRTTTKTLARRQWVPTDQVLREVEERLRPCKPGVITLAGSGEPTLHGDIGQVIAGIKTFTDIPVAVLNPATGRDVRPSCRQGALGRARTTVRATGAGHRRDRCWAGGRREGRATNRHGDGQGRIAEVWALIQRRPCTVEQVARGLGIGVDEALKWVDRLVEQGRAVYREEGGLWYVTALGVSRDETDEITKEDMS